MNKSYDERALEDPLISRVLTWRRKTTDGFIIAEIFFGEVYDKLRPLQEGDVVVDAGAHIGVFTVRASLKVGKTGKVYAFEPERENFKYLSLNTKGLENVEIFEKALWSSKGSKTLYHSKGNTGGHSLFSYNGREAAYEVKTVRLDDVVTGKVDFLKMDVERSELEVLRGAEKILEKYRPYIAAELHEGPRLVNAVISFLSKYGYKLKSKDASFIFEA